MSQAYQPCIDAGIVSIISELLLSLSHHPHTSLSGSMSHSKGKTVKTECNTKKTRFLLLLRCILFCKN